MLNKVIKWVKKPRCKVWSLFGSSTGATLVENQRKQSSQGKMDRDAILKDVKAKREKDRATQRAKALANNNLFILCEEHGCLNQGMCFLFVENYVRLPSKHKVWRCFGRRVNAVLPFADRKSAEGFCKTCKYYWILFDRFGKWQQACTQSVRYESPGEPPMKDDAEKWLNECIINTCYYSEFKNANIVSADDGHSMAFTMSDQRTQGHLQDSSTSNRTKLAGGATVGSSPAALDLRAEKESGNSRMSQSSSKNQEASTISVTPGKARGVYHRWKISYHTYGDIKEYCGVKICKEPLPEFERFK